MNQSRNLQPQLPATSFASNQPMQSNQRLPSITQIPMQTNTTREGVKGYKIAVKSVKGY